MCNTYIKFPVIYRTSGKNSGLMSLKFFDIFSMNNQHKRGTSLKLNGLTLLLLVTTKLKVLASLQRKLTLGLARSALKSQNNLLGGLSLLVQDRLGLTTVTSLLSVVSSLTSSIKRGLTGLVLGDLVLSVLSAFFALAVGSSGLRHVNHC